MKNTKLAIALLTVVASQQVLAVTTPSVAGSKNYAPVRQHHVNSKAHANKKSYTSHHTSEAHAKKVNKHKTPTKSKSGVSNKTAPRKTSGKLALPLNQ